MQYGPMTQEQDRDAVCDWFADMTMVNQFAAAVNPEGWAREQTKNRPEMHAEFVRRAHIWVAFIEEVGAKESN